MQVRSKSMTEGPETMSEGQETTEKRCQNDHTDGRKTMSEEQLYGRGSVVFFGDFDEFDESLNHRISDSFQKTLSPESHWRFQTV